MSLKNAFITSSICLGIAFKLLFFIATLFFLQTNTQSESLLSNDVFKVGKSRRRLSYFISPLDNSQSNSDQAVVEQTETEDGNELFKKNKVPFFNFLVSFVSSIDLLSLRIQNGLASFIDAHSYSLSSKKYLCISVLRI